MKEISNSTLALLVVVAIVASVFGTLVSLSKLNQFGGIGGITGLYTYNATQLGKANLTVPSQTYINATDNVIELGTLDLGLTNTSDVVDDWWVVINEGSVNISIEIYDSLGDSQESAGMGPFTTTGTGGCALTCSGDSRQCCFLVKCKNSTSPGFAVCNDTYDALPLADGGRKVIKYLAPFTANNTVWFGVNVTVPLNQPAKDYDQWVEFYATAS